ncbi:MAG: hypothetical protein U1A07_19425, partial [Phenylobacterium sp.]|nr:hypothetical protein [Phenylobacterium sp.]
MKIKNRRQPLDFQNLTEAEAASACEAEAPEAGPDLDLDLTDAPVVGTPRADLRDEPRISDQPESQADEAPFTLADPVSAGDLTRPRTPPATGGRSALTAQASAPADREAEPPAWPIYAGALAISVLCAFAPMAYAWGYRGDVVPFQNDAFALGVFALLA